MYTFAATLLVNEINAYTIKEELGNIVRERVDKNQKDYILREELAAINEELDGGTITEAYVKEQVKQIVKYRPEAVYVEGNAFETYPVIRALRKKHIPVLTMIENKEKKIMVRIP